jgi:hypothetical protein
MMSIQKSAIFMRQWQEYAQDYKNRAGSAVAERFIVAVEESLQFIEKNPHACTYYAPTEDCADLQAHQFRKWNLRGFPHMVLFRLKDNATVFIEVLYAHKMDIPSRLTKDVP